MIWLVLKSLSRPGGEGLTLGNYVVAFGTWRYLEAIWNSLQVAFAVAVLGLLMGVPSAWAVARTDMPLKRLVQTCVLGSFITPAFLGAIAWILLAGPNAGWLNQVFTTLTGAAAGPFNVYSLTGLIVVIALYTYPYAFLFTTTALELMSSEMEDAAAILGASVFRTMAAVTVPLALPALAAAFIMAFLESVAIFGSPLLIAVPARIQVITTQLFQFFQFPSKVELAAAYALPLLLMTAGLLWVQRRLLVRKHFATFGGKGGARRIVRLGRWRYVFLGYCLLVATLSLFLPYLVLLSASLSKAWARGWTWANFTLEHFRWVLLTHDTTRGAIVNSLIFSAAAATAAVALAFLVAYMSNRRLGRGAHLLGYVAMAPYVIPGIVLAIGFLAAYARPPLFLYGTAWIMILAFTTRFLPIAYANSDAALKSVHSELEDAARIAGAGPFLTLREVTVPLIKRGILGGWLLVLIAALRELSSAIFLFSANTKVMSIVLIDLSEEGDFERLATLGVVMLVVTTGLVLIGYRIVGRQFLATRE
ncbi:MAG: iron ABC transporter permease [Candidatus Rokubacteria bacterium]|nr:iron ABC transporter permease [Candidatus Rokubacteria bacterium]